jgi:hypothetical protein
MEMSARYSSTDDRGRDPEFSLRQRHGERRRRADARLAVDTGRRVESARNLE